MRCLKLALFILAFICQGAAGQDLRNRYDGHLSYWGDSGRVRTTFYETLVATVTDELSAASRLQHRNALSVHNSPDDKELKLRFIRDFPTDFEEFVAIYHPSDFTELYPRSNIYLALLRHLADEYPEAAASLLVSLSKDATYSADATGDLQRIMTDFIINHYSEFIMHFKALPSDSRKRLSVFLADVETISTSPKYSKVLDLFQKRNEPEFYQMFLRSKEDRIARGHE